MTLFVSDAIDDEATLRCGGLMLSLLGTAEPDTMSAWFSALSDGGRVVDDLRKRPWGDVGGQVVDRYGLHWLIGFQDDAANASVTAPAQSA